MNDIIIELKELIKTIPKLELSECCMNCIKNSIKNIKWVILISKQEKEYGDRRDTIE